MVICVVGLVSVGDFGVFLRRRAEAFFEVARSGYERVLRSCFVSC